MKEAVHGYSGLCTCTLSSHEVLHDLTPISVRLLLLVPTSPLHQYPVVMQSNNRNAARRALAHSLTLLVFWTKTTRKEDRIKNTGLFRAGHRTCKTCPCIHVRTRWPLASAKSRALMYFCRAMRYILCHQRMKLWSRLRRIRVCFLQNPDKNTSFLLPANCTPYKNCYLRLLPSRDIIIRTYNSYQRAKEMLPAICYSRSPYYRQGSPAFGDAH